MGKDISVNRSPTPKLNELIKLAIGTRSLRQVEEESGISHGLLGKVLNNTQKASVDKQTPECRLRRNRNQT